MNAQPSAEDLLLALVTGRVDLAPAPAPQTPRPARRQTRAWADCHAAGMTLKEAAAFCQATPSAGRKWAVCKGLRWDGAPLGYQERCPGIARGIIRITAIETGVSVREIMGDSRVAAVSAARQRAMHRMRVAGYSLPGIGKALGRHHQTIMHGLEAEEKRQRRADQ